MPIAAFAKALTVWLWLCIFQAGLLLAQSGPQPRFWFLLLAAFSTLMSLHFFRRSSGPDSPLRPRRIERNDRTKR